MEVDSLGYCIECNKMSFWCMCDDECDHNYASVRETWEWEKFRCTKCGDTYKIYEDEIR